MCSTHPPALAAWRRDLRACTMPGAARVPCRPCSLTAASARTHVPAVAKAATSIDDASANSDDDHFAPPAAAVSVPSSAPAAAPAAALSPPPASPQEAERALAGAVRATQNTEMDTLPGPSAQQRVLGRPTLAAGGTRRVGGRVMGSLAHEARASMNPAVDVAGMLVSDIGKDLGF